MDHRVRLDDKELALVVAALRARRAGVGLGRKSDIVLLLVRLEEMMPGNPDWVHGRPLTLEVE